MRTDADRLQDILTAAGKIHERLPDGFDEFLSDEMVQVWVVHYLQVIGEAARGISRELKERHPEVPWLPVIALRNILVHEYFGLNLSQVWIMARRDLPRLAEQIRTIYGRIASGQQ